MFKRKHPARGQRSLVNLRSGEAVEGVIVGQHGEYLSIQGASIHSQDSSGPVPAEGTVIVDLGNVSFIQVP